MEQDLQDLFGDVGSTDRTWAGNTLQQLQYAADIETSSSLTDSASQLQTGNRYECHQVITDPDVCSARDNSHFVATVRFLMICSSIIRLCQTSRVRSHVRCASCCHSDYYCAAVIQTVKQYSSDCDHGLRTASRCRIS